MRVLLLGGSGFVSGAILRELLDLEATGDDVVTVLTRGRTRTDWAGVRHIIGDRSDPGSMQRALAERYDVVVDVSGFTADDVSVVLGSLPTPPQRYVFISSAAVYDSRRAAVPFRETEGLGGDPVWGAYGSDKLAAEQLLRDELGDRAFILRPPYVYGPGNNLEREDFLWARILEARPILVPDGDRTEVQFCHVDSIARFVRAVVTDPSIAPGSYNLGDDRSYTFAAYIELLADVAGMPVPPLRPVDNGVSAREYFPFRDHPLVLDIGRWTGTGHAHVVPFRAGLADTLAWFLAHDAISFRPVPLEMG